MSAQDIVAYASLILWGGRFAWLLGHPAAGRRAARKGTPPPPAQKAAEGIVLGTHPDAEHLAVAAVQRHFGPDFGRSGDLGAEATLLVVLRGRLAHRANRTAAVAVLSVVPRASPSSRP